MRLTTMSAIVGCSLILAASPLAAQDFTGTYTVQAPAGNVVTLVLRQNQKGKIKGELSGNGTVVQIEGRLEEGNLVGTATSASGTGFAAATLQGDSLQFMIADFGPNGAPNFATAQAIVLTRAAAASAVPPAARATPAPPPPPATGTTQDQQLTQLLLSSPWCTFRYNQTTGYSSSSRYVFAPDGMLSFGSNSEGGTTNQNGGGTVNLGGGATGSYYSQKQGGGQMRWQVRNGILSLDQGDGLQPVQMQVKQNSNGYPIIIADGTEYSQCR